MASFTIFFITSVQQEGERRFVLVMFDPGGYKSLGKNFNYSLAIKALQKIVQVKFKHLLMMENGEVIALLDITNCLYNAISKMEKATE
ncbi:CBS domain-containing protein CBSCBSPB3-like [Tripterygium wilfordii]|uniref:CBS domain-containing protein CBSCBSPB3-like n=1 Tax=Tripterygium wilfordii TaxID=458696 RepID=A0A7J7CJJ0_TRIWF|nr:CBS domain-containing protein CBSCBSPB3-like [Tripterygium wilfordii]